MAFGRGARQPPCPRPYLAAPSSTGNVALLEHEGMAYKLVKIGGAVAMLAIVGGCIESTVSGPVAISHCGVISHDVANLDDPNPRHAYWCKRDDDGYLGEERPGRAAPNAPN
jgi:hypothetical protein